MSSAISASAVTLSAAPVTSCRSVEVFERGEGWPDRRTACGMPSIRNATGQRSRVGRRGASREGASRSDQAVVVVWVPNTGPQGLNWGFARDGGLWVPYTPSRGLNCVGFVPRLDWRDALDLRRSVQ